MISNHLLYQLQLVTIHLAIFNETKHFKKTARKMFSEQIIKFELRGPGPLDRTCNPETDYFCDKTKTLNPCALPA